MESWIDSEEKCRSTTIWSSAARSSISRRSRPSAPACCAFSAARRSAFFYSFSWSPAYYQVEPDEVGLVSASAVRPHAPQPGPHFKFAVRHRTVTKVPVQRQLKQEFGFRTDARRRPEHVPQGREDRRRVAHADRRSERRRPSSGSCSTRSPIPTSTCSSCATSSRRFRADGRGVDAHRRRRPQRDRAADRGPRVDRRQGQGAAAEPVQAATTTASPSSSWCCRTWIRPSRSSRRSTRSTRRSRSASAPSTKPGPSTTRRSRARAAWPSRRSQGAEGYAVDRVNRAKGDAQRFIALEEEYRKAPEVTRTRIYLETMSARAAGRRQEADLRRQGQGHPAAVSRCGGGATPRDAPRAEASHDPRAAGSAARCWCWAGDALVGVLHGLRDRAGGDHAVRPADRAVGRRSRGCT